MAVDASCQLHRGDAMSARAISFIKCFVSVFLAVLAVSIAVLEVIVAVKFQFPVEIKVLDMGFLWLLNLELPEAVTAFAMWAGAALWLTIAINFWVEVFKNKTQKLNATEITAFTTITAVPVWGAISGPFALAVWLNAGMWILAAISAAQVANDFAES